MYRIDDETATSSMPSPERTGTEGFFTEGNPITGTVATSVRASWLNMVQEELRNIVLAGGITPAKDSHTQVLEALLAKFSRRVTVAYGKPDELVALFTPPISQLTDGLSVLIRAAYSNASSSVIFRADSKESKSVVKGNDLPLITGDIAGEGHWLELQYDAKLDKWVLQNPARGIAVLELTAEAEGTEETLKANFIPPVKELTHGLTVRVRALHQNQSAIPTFQADETETSIIVKGNDLPLAEGDIAGEGHWLELQYDAKLGNWVLQNPAKGIAVNAGVPVGAIEYFAMQTPPPGYLKCDGAIVGRATYPDLFAAIGTTFGEGDGTNTFKLPELRGEFMRGWDDGRGVDEGREFGSGQGDAIRNITGDIGTVIATGSNGAIIHGGSYVPVNGGSNTYTNYARIDASRIVPTAAENRPRNIALLACIKAFDVSVNPALIDIAELANDVAGKAPIVSTFGFDQTWRDVKAQRALNTTYTNTTAQPIFVEISVYAPSGGWNTYLKINGYERAVHGTGTIGGRTEPFFVFPGETYSFRTDNAVLNTWMERR